MKGTIRIHLRIDKTLKDGKAPIEVVYSVEGQKKRFSIGQKILPAYWDGELQRGVYIPLKEAKKILKASDLLTEREIQDINESLSDLIRALDNCERDFERKGKLFSSQMIVDKLKEGIKPTTKKEEPNNFLFDFMDKYVEDHSATRNEGSLKVYRTTKKHLQDFQSHKRKRITFDGIDFQFFQSFQNYLIDVKKLQNTTVAKALKTVKTFLGYARLQGIEVSDRYKDFKINRESLEVIALTQSEFDALLNKDLSKNKKLEQVRDVFCFSCATGLRYSDLKQLRREHIKEDEICLTIHKTKERLNIPLTDCSLSILNKYAGYKQPLPVISNQKMNEYLKELCELVEINEKIEIVRYRGAKREAIIYPKYELITVHTGRKTFATLSLEKGMSAEEVMTITGHRDYKSFKRYVKITEERKKVVMLKAWGGESINKLKIV